MAYVTIHRKAFHFPGSTSDSLNYLLAQLQDSESSMDVRHCTEPGCYSRAINYNATSRQITALSELSNECH